MIINIYFRRVFYVLLWALCTIGCIHNAQAWTDEEISGILQNISMDSIDSNASAAILATRTQISILDATHRETTGETLLLIISGKAKHEYGDVKIMFDSRFEQIEIQAAKTLSETGEWIGIMEGADNTIIPPELMDAAVYGSVKQRIISFSNVEPGSILYWKVKRTTSYPENERYFWGDFAFQHDIPVLQSECSISHPSGMPFHISKLNGLSEPDIRNEKDTQYYHWKFDHIPMTTPEWGMTSRINVVPRFEYSTAPSWDAISNWFRLKTASSVPKESKLPKKVSELTKGLMDSRSKIDAIYRWIAEDVRTINLDLGMRDYLANDPQKTFQNQFGDSLDKSALLIQMLKIAGFKAEFVLIGTPRSVTKPQIPSLNYFDTSCVLTFSDDSQPLWLDPTCRSCQAGFFFRGQGNKAFHLGNNSGELIDVPVMSPEASQSTQTVELTVDASGAAHGRLRWSGTGYFDLISRKILQLKTPREQRIFFERLLSASTISADLQKLTQCDWSDHSVNSFVEMEINIPNFALVEGSMMIIQLPDTILSFGQIGFPSAKAQTTYPLELDSMGKERFDTRITFPDGFVSLVHPGQAAESQYGVSVNQNTSLSGQTLNFSREWTWSQLDIPVDQYIAIKQLYDAYHHLEKNIVLLERKSGNH